LGAFLRPVAHLAPHGSTIVSSNKQPPSGEPIRVLVIDDNRSFAETVSETLQRVGYDCTIATSGPEGARLIESDDWDVVLTDLRMAELDGLAIVRKAREAVPDAEVVVITGFGDVKTAVEAIKQGAANYLTKPVDMEELRAIVQKASERTRLARANRDLRRQLDERFGLEGVIGNSPRMQEVIRLIQAAASTDVTVLILGETGTGKDLVAKAIHTNSRRKSKPFAPMDCTALNENLIEDELFGHEPGAFTGGERQRKGRFEYANGGTLFLDEIGDMPLKLQAKLLRVLENKEIIRIGANEPIKVNVRLISATHRNLQQMIEEKQFRLDLFQRLKVFTIRMPPLRERREDIPLLAAHFIKEMNAQHGKHVTAIAEPVRRAMSTYDWLGNVRELRNFIESMVVVDTDHVLGLDDVEADSPVIPRTHAPVPGPTTIGAGGLIGRPLGEVERYYSEQALALTGNNREEAARMLGIGERTLYRNIQDWKLQDRIRQVLSETDGDLSAAARVLEMDVSDLQAKVRKFGLGDGER
jgi:two-component system, NtrC family, response regulator HydG